MKQRKSRVCLLLMILDWKASCSVEFQDGCGIGVLQALPSEQQF
jgi:hypothetical protein